MLLTKAIISFIFPLLAILEYLVVFSPFFTATMGAEDPEEPQLDVQRTGTLSGKTEMRGRATRVRDEVERALHPGHRSLPLPPGLRAQRFP